jgi:hypothetical protein
VIAQLKRVEYGLWLVRKLRDALPEVLGWMGEIGNGGFQNAPKRRHSGFQVRGLHEPDIAGSQTLAKAADTAVAIGLRWLPSLTFRAPTASGLVRRRVRTRLAKSQDHPSRPRAVPLPPRRRPANPTHATRGVAPLRPATRKAGSPRMRR